MPKYIEVAKEANAVAQSLMKYVSTPLEELGDDLATYEAKVAEMIARLINLGIRCSPRGVQHTVRLNAVREAVRGLPVRVSMEERKDERTGRTYNVLVTQQLVAGHLNGQATTEALSDEE